MKYRLKIDPTITVEVPEIDPYGGTIAFNREWFDKLFEPVPEEQPKDRPMKYRLKSDHRKVCDASRSFYGGVGKPKQPIVLFTLEGNEYRMPPEHFEMLWEPVPEEKPSPTPDDSRVAFIDEQQHFHCKTRKDMHPEPNPTVTQPSLMDLMETAWGIVCNVGGGDWSTQTKEWRAAAWRLREQWHKVINEMPTEPPTPSEQPDPSPTAIEEELEAAASLPFGTVLDWKKHDDLLLRAAAEIRELRKKSDPFEKERLQAEVASLTEDRDERAKQKGDFFSEIERLKEEVRKLSADRDHLQAKTDGLMTAVDLCHSKLNAANVADTFIGDRVENLIQERDRLKAENERLSETLRESTRPNVAKPRKVRLKWSESVCAMGSVPVVMTHDIVATMEDVS